MDTKDYYRVFLYSFSTTIIGWRVLLMYNDCIADLKQTCN